MTLEAGKEMDKHCVLNWLNEVYVTPSRAFNEYTDEELKMFAHDALVLLKEQPEIVRCKDCKWRGREDDSPKWIPCLAIRTNNDWFCADGERKE